ncbi:MAG: hypothetical protein WBC44_04750, partial [Planctomycetaceae bacterium]
RMRGCKATAASSSGKTATAHSSWAGSNWLACSLSLSGFDGGSYHTVEHFCPPKVRWDHYQTGITINMARQLHQPLNHIEFPQDTLPASAADLSNELLAEAQVSLFRGLTRSAVINSYQAVESLANVVFKAAKAGQLVREGLPNADAEAEAENIRVKHRVDIRFLIHEGLRTASGRSYCAEHKAKYDALYTLNKLRHQVAHAGRKPSRTEAENAHLLCCEAIQWLCEVGGFPVRALLPEPENVAPSLLSLPAEVNSIPNAAEAFLRWVLGIPQTEEAFAANCQFGLQIGKTAGAERPRS